MNLFDFHTMLYIIYPQFVVVRDRDGKKLILLDDDCDTEDGIDVFSVFNSRTEFEALNNHVHLFNKVKIKDQRYVEDISTSIALNLKKSLMLQFPQNEFIVYLDMNFNDSVILRFHQIWENEDLYYDPRFLTDDESNQLRII